MREIAAAIRIDLNPLEESPLFSVILDFMIVLLLPILIDIATLS